LEKLRQSLNVPITMRRLIYFTCEQADIYVAHYSMNRIILSFSNIQPCYRFITVIIHHGRKMTVAYVVVTFLHCMTVHTNKPTDRCSSGVAENHKFF
jgi:hypothetical protein